MIYFQEKHGVIEKFGEGTNLVCTGFILLFGLFWPFQLFIVASHTNLKQ